MQVQTLSIAPATIKRSRHLALALLVLVSVVSYVDRQILAVVLQAVRADLGLTDTQLGLLTGAFFSVTFVVAGVPLARFADRGDRRTIIAACMVVWSLATAACGLVQSFGQLALARTAVAIGEAGSAPASYSLLSDLYPERQRARIFSVLSAGSALGLAFGVFVAGRLSDLLGWRATFAVVALPGLVLAILLRTAIREPARTDAGTGDYPSLAGVFMILLRIATFRWLMIVTVAASVTTFAMLGWMPTFLIRMHGLSASQVGTSMGSAIALGLLCGNLISGALADRLRARDPRWLMWLAATGLLLCVPTGLLTLMTPGLPGTIAALGCYMFFMGFWSPLLATIAVGLVPGHARAVAASTIPILQGLGGAIGPWMVGALNDHWAGRLGAGAIRASLVASLAGCVVAGLAGFVAAAAVRRDYRPGGSTMA